MEHRDYTLELSKTKNRVYYGYEFPGVFESPVILNLHLRLWDSKIAGRMSSLRPSLDAREG